MMNVGGGIWERGAEGAVSEKPLQQGYSHGCGQYVE